MQLNFWGCVIDKRREKIDSTLLEENIETNDRNECLIKFTVTSVDAIWLITENSKETCEDHWY